MAEATHRGRRVERPLSPHLQIYTPLINMVMSILHRITGAALYFGTLLLAWWLVAAAAGPEAYAMASQVMGHPVGLLVLAGYTWALMHHAFGGIRHFVWDMGHGFELGTVNAMCWMTLVASFSATAGIWVFILRAKGVI